MTFVLSGLGNSEAFDEESGIRIQSLGMRGPEIANHDWRAVGNGIDFELSTYVDERGDLVRGKRRVWLFPSPELVDYLLNGPGSESERKVIINKVIEGVALLFASRVYLAPFFFERIRRPPELWSGISPNKQSSASAETAATSVVMSSGQKVSLPVTLEPRRIRLNDFFLIGVSVWMTAIFLGVLPDGRSAPGWLHYALVLFPILLVLSVIGVVVRLVARKRKLTFSAEGFEDSWRGSVPWTSVSGLHRFYGTRSTRLLTITLQLIPGGPVQQNPLIAMHSWKLQYPGTGKRFVIGLTRLPNWQFANELVDLLFNRSLAGRAQPQDDVLE